jgi:hypothetical protein
MSEINYILLKKRIIRGEERREKKSYWSEWQQNLQKAVTKINYYTR